VGRCDVGQSLTRRALYFTAPCQIAIRTEELAGPAAGQVLVQTLVSAISPGTELLIYRGQAPTDMAADETIAALAGNLAFPLKYGYAAVGRVTAVGSAAEEAWQDRLVFAFHPHESHFLAVPAELLPVPATLAYEDAVFLPNMETAVNFLMDGQPLIGERVVVFGQGIVGLLTTALLAPYPLACLLTLDRYAQRREHSLALGAQTSLDPEMPHIQARLQSCLQEGDGAAGADLTYELSGNPGALDQAIATTGFDGRIVIGSWYGQKQTELNLGGRFHRSRIRLISSQVSTIAPAWTGRWTKSRRLKVAWQMLERVRPARLITHRIPLIQAHHAYMLLDQCPQEALQVLLTYER
jgi:2-desacetyl-2-hydroxyethyl bacteriochlorophyllide A dehydrogenase